MDYIVGVPIGLLQEHECEAIVATCIDFRFWEATLLEFVRVHLGLKTKDPIFEPGCTKFFLEKVEPFAGHLEKTIALSIKLHNPKQLILVHHATCGAYGIADAKIESAKQREDMLAARELLAKEFPTLSIRMFFASGHGEREILYQEVK